MFERQFSWRMSGAGENHAGRGRTRDRDKADDDQDIVPEHLGCVVCLGKENVQQLVDVFTKQEQPKYFQPSHKKKLCIFKISRTARLLLVRGHMPRDVDNPTLTSI